MWQQNDYASKFDASWEKVAKRNYHCWFASYLLVDRTSSPDVVVSIVQVADTLQRINVHEVTNEEFIER